MKEGTEDSIVDVLTVLIVTHLIPVPLVELHPLPATEFDLEVEK